MTETTEPTDEQLEDLTGMPPVEDVEEESTEDTEADAEADTKEETTEDETKEPETETEEVEEEEPEEKSRVKRTVPQDKVKPEKVLRQKIASKIDENKVLEDRIKELEANQTTKDDIADGVKEALTDISKTKEGDKPDAIKEAAEKLGDELGIDTEGIEKILRTAKDLSTAELKTQIDKLKEDTKDLDEMKKERDNAKEKEYFNNEWDKVVPDLKKSYEGITDAILDEAKAKLDELSHTDAYFDKDLDYVLFKEKKVFETILKVAPKDKGGEKSKTVSIQDNSEGDEMVNIEDLTPEIMAAREKRELNRQPEKTEYSDMQITEPMD